jgi:hypothetical protein
LGWSIGFRIRI